jgi:hypothetical protein
MSESSIHSFGSGRRLLGKGKLSVTSDFDFSFSSAHNIIKGGVLSGFAYEGKAVEYDSGS